MSGIQESNPNLTIRRMELPENGLKQKFSETWTLCLHSSSGECTIRLTWDSLSALLPFPESLPSCTQILTIPYRDMSFFYLKRKQPSRPSFLFYCLTLSFLSLGLPPFSWSMIPLLIRNEPLLMRMKTLLTGMERPTNRNTTNTERMALGQLTLIPLLIRIDLLQMGTKQVSKRVWQGNTRTPSYWPTSPSF